jgi:hypothetical protein
MTAYNSISIASTKHLTTVTWTTISAFTMMQEDLKKHLIIKHSLQAHATALGHATHGISNLPLDVAAPGVRRLVTHTQRPRWCSK